MGLARHFPTVMWMGRVASSRLARKVWLSLALLILTPVIVYRAHAAWFVWKVHRLLTSMSTLQVGRTTQEEVLTKIPGLHLTKAEGCDQGSSCFFLEMRYWPFSLRGGHAAWYKFNYWLGERLTILEVRASFEKGVLRRMSYFVQIDDGTLSYPGVIMAGVSSGPAEERAWTTKRDVSPEYWADRYFKRPDTYLRVWFSPRASVEQVQHAFDIRLGCALEWGCHKVDELLPTAIQDLQQVELAAAEWEKRADRCPLSILPGRARNVAGIALVEVTADLPVKPIKFKLLHRFKGNTELRGDFLGGGVDEMQKRSGSEIKPLKPGTKLIWFADRRNYVENCYVMPSTDKAIRLIEDNLPK